LRIRENDRKIILKDENEQQGKKGGRRKGEVSYRNKKEVTRNRNYYEL
jgi:hypothetical protein